MLSGLLSWCVFCVSLGCLERGFGDLKQSTACRLPSFTDQEICFQRMPLYKEEIIFFEFLLFS